MTTLADVVLYLGIAGLVTVTVWSYWPSRPREAAFDDVWRYDAAARVIANRPRDAEESLHDEPETDAPPLMVDAVLYQAPHTHSFAHSVMLFSTADPAASYAPPSYHASTGPGPGAHVVYGHGPRGIDLGAIAREHGLTLAEAGAVLAAATAATQTPDTAGVGRAIFLREVPPQTPAERPADTTGGDDGDAATTRPCN